MTAVIVLKKISKQVRFSFARCKSIFNKIKFKFIGEITNVNMSRLALCESTASVLATCLHLLGLQTIEKM